MKLVHFLKSHVQFTVFLVLALLIGGVAVFAPAIAPADPYEAVMDNSLLPPDGSTSAAPTSWGGMCSPV